MTTNPTPPPVADEPAKTGASDALGGGGCAMAAPDDWGPPWVGAYGQRRRLDLVSATVAGALLASATVFFGWRALLAVLVSGIAAVATHHLVYRVVRRVRHAHFEDPCLHVATLGCLAALTLDADAPWPTPLILGAVVGAIAHITGRARSVRVHPLVLGVLLVSIAGVWQAASRPSHDLDAPVVSGAVLRPNRLVFGDVKQTTPWDLPAPWWRCDANQPADAVLRPPPYKVLLKEQMLVLQHDWRLAYLLSSGQLRPMGELLLGAVPGPIGMTSPALVTLVGLYLMFRRVSAAPIAVGAFGSAIAALAIMPVAYHGGWTTVAARLVACGPLITVTYVGYMILASPLPWVALIFAPSSAPIGTPGRLIYGSVIGAGLIALQWSVGTALAGYLVLAVAGLMTPWLDTLARTPFTR